jgi:3-(3-hydroxy-phenyl)propionate hydroxylase
MPEQKDKVIVVGGGPVGLTAALLLAQRGVPVTVIEKSDAVHKDYRASTFHAGTLDLLESSGITQALLDMGLQAPTFQYRGWKEGKIAEFDHALLKNDTRHPFRVQCEQFKLSEFLRNKLSTMPMATLLYGHEVYSVEQSDDRVRVRAKISGGKGDATGGQESDVTVDGSLLIGADGGRSAVRKTLGIEFPGFTYPERILVFGLGFDLRQVFPDIALINYISDPENYAHMLRIPDMWRLSLPIPTEISDEQALTDDYIAGRLQAVIPELRIEHLRLRGIYHVHQRVVDKYRHGRVFLAGDAAHLNNPKGGMGLNGGLHDAVSLTDRIARYWHEGIDELDGYDAHRRPEAIDAIHHQTQANYTALKESNVEARERVFANWRRIAADPALAYEHLLKSSMIASLRRCGMLPAPHATMK